VIGIASGISGAASGQAGDACIASRGL